MPIASGMPMTGTTASALVSALTAAVSPPRLTASATATATTPTQQPAA